MNGYQRRRFRIHTQNYIEIDQVLYRKKHDRVLLRYVSIAKIAEVIKEFHFKTFESHFFDYTTVDKIIQVEYYWPTMFKEACTKAQSCENIKDL